MGPGLESRLFHPEKTEMCSWGGFLIGSMEIGLDFWVQIRHSEEGF